MRAARTGDRVKVHYTGTLGDGTEFDSSRDREPLEITIGEKQVISGFENALMGMSKGEKKRVTIPCEEAYGTYDDAHVGYVARSQLPDDFEISEGMVLEVKSPTGEMTKVMVKKIDDESVVLDGNHPLAGKKLTFELELVEIEST
jgi:peptidylprolyl isomerase